MKILFVAPRFHTNQSTIVDTLIREGNKIFFHVSTIGPIENHSQVKPVIVEESIISKLITKIIGDRSKNRKKYFPDLFKYYSIIKKISPDIVIIRRHGRVFSYMAAIYCNIFKSKVIFYDQINSNFFNSQQNKSFRSYIKKLKFISILKIFNAAWFTPLHNSDQNTHLPDRCYYLPFAVDIKIDSKLTINTPIQLLTIGKYYKRKNHQLLIEALVKIKDDYDFHLTIVGEVSNDTHRNIQLSIKDLVRKAGLENKIEFFNNIPFNKMESIYGSNDLFILPASHEPASIAVLEAMGYGLPVICSDSCGTETYIKRKYNGDLFISDSVESLSSTIEKYLSDENHILKQKKWLLDNAFKTISGENYYKKFSSMVSTEKKNYRWPRNSMNSNDRLMLH